MKPRNLIIGFALIALAVCLPALGEVSAKLDDEGNYVGMIFKMSTASRIWASAAPTIDRRPLNPTGDLLGDLAPTVMESSLATRWPVAVWSHPNGGDYDLVFSRWSGRSWSPMAFVEQDNPYNDLDPRLVMNSVGRPYMVWSRMEPTGGAIFFSIFLESRWMTPIRVTGTGVNGYQPNLSITNDTHVTVTFMTSVGPQFRVITIPNTTSITDDIDPKIRLEIQVN